MKSNHITIVLAIILVTVWDADCYAGAWTSQKGNLYERLAFNYYYAEKEFDDDGDRKGFVNNGDFQDFNLGNYLEYGVTDNVTLINSLYYKYVVKDDDTMKNETYGIGDIDLGLKCKTYEGENGVFSAQALAKIPEAYDEDDDLPIGNGQYDLELRLLYGRSLYPYLPGYCNFEAGYRWREGDPSDELRYLIEFGGDITRQFYGRAKLDGIYSMDNGKRTDNIGNPATTNNFDLGKLDLTLGYKASPSWGVETSWVPAIYGQNTSAGATFSLAVYLKTL